MTPVNHWNELESWPSDPPPVIAAALELRDRVAALEAAQTAPVATPAATTSEPSADSINRLAAIIRKVGCGGGEWAVNLAKAILRDPDAAAVFASAPMEWPVLSVEPPSVTCSPCYREGRRSGWLNARLVLAAMNPNRQEEGRNDG